MHKDPIHIKKGIQTLIKRKDLVIRPADKGGGVVLQTKINYLTEIERQLSDESTYIKLPKNLTLQIKRGLEQIVQKGVSKSILNNKEARYLVPELCRIPVIYTVPKIHKNKENPPGRPIVNGINSVTSRLGEYIDNFIQPAVQCTKAYLKDTKHILQLLDGPTILEGRTILATADVCSLYTSIKHHQACEATKWVLKHFTNLHRTQRKYLIKCIDFSLKNNYFWHQQEFYKQVTRIAMGAKYAPSVANAFMAQWEEEAVHNNTPCQLELYKRFIDDVIIIWNGDRVTRTIFNWIEPEQ